MVASISAHNAKSDSMTDSFDWSLNKMAGNLQKIFSNIFLDENAFILVKLSLNFVPHSQINC